MGRPNALILSCEAHKHFLHACLEGLRVFWPEVEPMVLMDSDAGHKSEVPEDIREVIGRVPYLRKVFDLPRMANSETVYIMDCDCLLFGKPDDFFVPRYQGVPGYADDGEGVEIWKTLGVEFDETAPRLCGGLYSCETWMFDDNRDLSYEYVRECVRRGIDKTRYPGVIMEQSLQAGLFRKTYKNIPLDPERYPIHRMTDSMRILHMGALKFGKYCAPVMERFWSNLDRQRGQAA